jgi:hypothetical protein
MANKTIPAIQVKDTNVGIGTTDPNYKLTVAPLATFGNSEDGNINIIASPSGGTYSDTTVGGIVFGDQTLTNGYGGRLAVIQDNPSLSTLTHMRFYTNSGGGNSFTLERMRITGAGNVGIGTSAPVAKLHIKDPAASSSQIKMSAASNEANYGYLTMTDNTVNTAILTIGTTFGYNTPIDAITIFNGNVGIGTPGPGFKLDVAGTFHSAGDATFNGTNFYVNSSYSYIGNNTTDVVSIAGNTMYLPGNGRVGIGATTPRTRLDVEDYTAFMSLSSAINSEATTPDQQIGGIDFRKHYALAIGASIRQLQAGTLTNYSQAHLAFYTNDGSVAFGSVGPERMRITSGGQVLINTTTNYGSTLVVDGSFRLGGTYSTNWENYSYGSYIDVFNNQNALRIRNSSSTIMLEINGGSNYFAGNLGVGGVSPAIRFVNAGGALSSGPTLGSGTVGSQALLSANTLYGMYSGVSSSGDVWHQVQRNDGNTTVYNLLLQPSGGNVGIGTNPNRKLTVSGDISSNFGSNQGSLWLGEVVNQVASFTSYGILDFTLHHGSGYADIMRIQGNGRVGIGTTNPTSQLHVYTNNDIWHTTIGGASGELRIGGQHGGGAVIQSTTPGGSARDLYLQRDGGYVGIGTANPSQVLSVAGNAIIGQGLSRPVTYDCGGGNFRIKGNAGGWATGYFFDGSAGTYKGGFGAFGSSDTLSYHWIGDDWNIPTMVIRPNQGNVGIGTTNPDAYPFDAKLSVAGNISVTGTKIGWGVTDAFTLNGINTAHYGLSSNFNLVQLSGYGGVVFATTGTERMRITGGGNILVNTTVDLGSNLNVNSTVRIGVTFGNEASVLFGDSGTAYWKIGRPAGSGNLKISSYALDAIEIQPTTGNVGIGTTNPITILHANSSSNTTAGLFIQNQSTNVVTIGNEATWLGTGSSNNAVVAAFGSNSLLFGTNATEKMRITDSGYVGIGQSNPQSLLHLKQPGSNFFRMSRGSASNYGFELGPFNDFYLYDYNNSRSSLTILDNGDIGINTNNPGAKLEVNGAVGIGIGGTIEPSAALEVKSNTQGFLPPRMSDTEMNSIAAPAAGLIVWNTDASILFVFDGSNWRKIAYA